MPPSYTFEPIGIVHSPFAERMQAPRQAPVAEGARAVIELTAGLGYEWAIEDLGGWEYLWVLFVFHRNIEDGRTWKPKVLPPRSEVRRGVFATRSPHRPNPIGLSAVRLERVDGLVLHIRNVDLLDGTPVLDIKPYVAYADAYPTAGSGWLESHDPRPTWQVDFDERALAALAWLRERGVHLQPEIVSVLSLGPQPHPYRRIRSLGAGCSLGLHDWRVDFMVDGERIVVREVHTGYKPRQLAEGDVAGPDGNLELHTAFWQRWG
ncbi:MAG: tRNA (N6-threonylcarbamoyladenosine(37)-N6)-methyltransferase TrmO [Polyangiaceae bacterium]|jgi:tRNA-Thr(GGU) m(6)t(6)A37 methyltransferase TsaA